MAADGALALGNIAGDITVTRGGGSDIDVEIVKTAQRPHAADARELLQLVPVEITERNGRAEVKTRYPSGDEQRRNNRRNINVNVAYTVTAPAGTRITVNSISGDIKVTDIKGDINANSISGDVRISGAGRVGAAKSISGTVEISRRRSTVRSTAQSVSGDVILRRVTARPHRGRPRSAATSSSTRSSASASARTTTSGNRQFTGSLARNGRYEFNSFSGEIRLVDSGKHRLRSGRQFVLRRSPHRDLPITVARQRSRRSGRARC